MPRRTDSNQAAIVEALRGVGCIVQDLSRVGKGCPDLLCSYVDPRTGRATNLLIEVKTATGKLEKNQVIWHALWRGSVVVVRTVDEALQAVGQLREANDG